MGKTYHYQVTSSTTDGYVSEPSNDVAIVRKNAVGAAESRNFRGADSGAAAIARRARVRLFAGPRYDRNETSPNRTSSQ